MPAATGSKGALRRERTVGIVYASAKITMATVASPEARLWIVSLVLGRPVSKAADTPTHIALRNARLDKIQPFFFERLGVHSMPNEASAMLNATNAVDINHP
jgi:hypothetical protein